MTAAPPKFKNLNPPLMTAEEFASRFDQGGYELVNGRLVEMPMPNGRHGEIALQAGHLVKCFLKTHNIGRAMSNDTFLLLRRKPDTVRGPDICYASYKKIPPGPAPSATLTVLPELVIEVLSPSDSLTEARNKQEEYLLAGVEVGILLNPRNDTATVFRAGSEPLELQSADPLTLPDVLPGFSITVREFFEF